MYKIKIPSKLEVAPPLSKMSDGWMCWIPLRLLRLLSTSHAIFLCSWDLEIWHRVATPK